MIFGADVHDPKGGRTKIIQKKVCADFLAPISRLFLTSQLIVAQCSAICVSVAATPRVARSVFARNFSCGTVTEGWRDRCDRVFFGGLWGL